MNKKILSFMAMCIGIILSAFVFTSCEKDKDKNDDNGSGNETSGGTESGMYMGIIGFNDNLQIKDIALLNANTKTDFINFIGGLEMALGTSLYYSFETAINKLEAAKFPDDLDNVAIVTFTDGLDMTSFGHTNKYDAYDDPAAAVTAYCNDLNLLKTKTIKGKPIKAYSIGIKGGDVPNTPEGENRFEGNLKVLASDNNSWYKANNMAEVLNKFREIANSLYQENVSQNLFLNLPQKANGSKYRITFDLPHIATADGNSSQCYIEGNFEKTTGTLKNIAYNGLSSNSGTSVTGTTISGSTYLQYQFSKFAMSQGFSYDKEKMNFYCDEGYGLVFSSEVVFDNNAEIKPEYKSAAIMLVLDCSSSLDENGANGFAEMKTAANEFINILINNKPVSSVSLNESNLTLSVGQTETLTATVLPTDANTSDKHWSSSNTSKATVSQNGLVTAVATGSATVTCTVGGKSASCNVTVTAQQSVPVVTTSAATSITTNSATFNGNITNAGTPTYTEKGFCYSTYSNPTTSDIKVTVSGTGTGSYAKNITGLSQNTTYYVRAYAINSQGTAYGSQVSFTTSTAQQNSQVRFSKTTTYADFVTIMAVVSQSTSEFLAQYNVGTGTGTSNYYTIPSGNHELVMYFTATEDQAEGWYYWSEDTHYYNFLPNRKYKVLLSDNGSNYLFTITDEGTFSKTTESTSKTTYITIPKSSIKPANKIISKKLL